MKINKKILASGLGLSLIFCIGSSSFAATGTVNTETVMVRKEATTDSDILSTFDLNDKVEVTGLEGEWYKVKAGNSDGYIHKNYLDVEEEVKTEEVKAEEVKTQEVTDAAQNTPEENKVPEKTELVAEKKDQKTERKIVNRLNDNTDLYVFPTYSSSKVSSGSKGTEVKIIKIFNNWTKISVGDKEGWVPNKKLIEIEGNATPVQEVAPVEVPAEQTPEKQEVNQKGYVNTESANLRQGPDTSFDIAAGLVEYEVLIIMSEQNGWYEVRTSDNINGFVHKDLVTIGEPPVTSRAAISRNQVNNVAEESYSEPVYAAEPSGVGGDIVATAQQFIGYDYVYGGSSPSTGFDCSGFTSYVYACCGKSISRTASAQAYDGVEVGDLQPGALLYFDNDPDGSIGHVGIYIGDGTFIHAANPSRGVVYDTIESGYYNDYFAGARRVY